MNQNRWQKHECLPSPTPAAPPRVVALNENAAARKCERGQMRNNDAKSNADVTRAEYADVHYPRMWRAAIVRHADNAINTARKKKWSSSGPRKPAGLALARARAVRYFDHSGEVQQAQPVELRRGRKGGRDFVVLKRCVTHRKRDRRVSLYVAVPEEYVIDALEPFVV